MKKITILINAELNFEFSNYMILSNALLRTNKFKVYLGLIDTISISSNVECNVLKLNKEIKGNDSFEAGSFEKTSLETMNYVWVMSFGKKQAFLDQIQILWVLDKKTKLLNSVESLMFLNNKHWLGQYLDIKHPETFITSDSEFILGLYEENKDDTWILKPTAGSLGKDVFKITQNDCNAKSLIQSMTNNKIGQYSIFQKFMS